MKPLRSCCPLCLSPWERLKRLNKTESAQSGWTHVSTDLCGVWLRLWLLPGRGLPRPLRAARLLPGAGLLLQLAPGSVVGDVGDALNEQRLQGQGAALCGNCRSHCGCLGLGLGRRQERRWDWAFDNGALHRVQQQLSSDWAWLDAYSLPIRVLVV